MAPADVPAIPAQELGHLPAVLKIYNIEPDTARSPRVSARAQRSHQDRKGTRSKWRLIGARDVVGLLRLAQCMETAKVFCNDEGCKRKRVGEDFSAFVRTKTAKAFGNY